MSKYEKVLILADSSIDNKPVALYSISGELVIERLMKQVSRLNAGKIYILSLKGFEDEFTIYFKKLGINNAQVITQLDDNSTKAYGLVLDTKNIYNMTKNRAEYRFSIKWQLASKKDIEYAESEINKDTLYPISRYYIRPWAQKIAVFLSWFSITPNQVTMVSFACGILGAYFLLFEGLHNCILAAVLYWLCVLLDHVDGYLARLKKLQSSFGAYLDTMTGMIVWLLIFISISYRLSVANNTNLYLIYGLIFIFADYIFNYTIVLKKLYDTDQKNSWEVIAASSSGKLSIIRIFKTIISYMDDMDLRIHFVLICILFNKLAYPFYYHIIYINLRWIMNMANEWLKYRAVSQKAG
ncbi:MAG: CDP-alcohol phosphatidyltransferase family protein [Candidatus Omnitrophica bacterium]|nr:CDP-alcohol phosphatidyltransferase family protein [Candidatus Omnitrophota bacterium]